MTTVTEESGTLMSKALCWSYSPLEDQAPQEIPEENAEQIASTTDQCTL
jgi:hypothetical protein